MAKELQSRVVLYGKVDASVDNMRRKIQSLHEAMAWKGMHNAGMHMQAIGKNMASMGAHMMRYSLPIAMLGKKVTDTTRDYQEGMNEILAVTNLAEGELEMVGQRLRDFAVTSRFTPTDTTAAFATLMRAGVDYTEGLELMADIIDYATAANIDLSLATDMMVNNLYATGTSFENAREYIDLMSVVATSTNTDIKGLSEAIVRMGATSRYFQNNDELLTWLGILGNMGFKGSEAGTHLRNVMLALAAPSKNAGEALGALGVNVDELSNGELDELQAALDEMHTEGGLEKLHQGLAQMGVSVYDSAGKMRPIVAVLQDLKKETDKMTDKDRNALLSQLFPKRTLASATGMMAMLEEYDTLYGKVTDNIEGNAARQAAAMDKGMVGARYYLESAWTELQISFGEEMAEGVIWLSDQLRGLAGAFSQLPAEEKMGWIKALAGLAVAGPGLLIAGKAIALLGKAMVFLSNPLGFAVAAVGALAWGIHYVHNNLVKLADERNFGNIEFDTEKLKAYYDTLLSKSFAANAVVKQHSEEMRKHLNHYGQGLTSFSETIVSLLTTGGTLSEADKATLTSYVEQMKTGFWEALTSAELRDKSLIEGLFGGDGTTLSKQLGLHEEVYTELRETARSLAEEFETAYKISIDDGNIDMNEKAMLDSIMSKQNALLSQIADANLYAELNKTMRLHKDAPKQMVEAALAALQAHSEESYAAIDSYVGLLQSQGRHTEAKEYQAAAEAEMAARKRAFSRENLLPLLSGQLSAQFADLLEGKGSIFQQWGDKGSLQAAIEPLLALYSIDDLDKDIRDGYFKTGQFDPILTGFNDLLYVAGLSERRFSDWADYSNFQFEQDPLQKQQLMEFEFAIGPDTARQLQAEAMTEGISYKEKLIEYASGLIQPVNTISPIVNYQIPTMPQGIGGKGQNMAAYAEGGRATEASIFGEAGAEWAIPERHDKRTLDLLSRAAAASGFSPAEVAGNMGKGDIHFAPVIQLSGDGNSGTENIEAALRRALADFEKILARREHDRSRLAF